MKDFLEDMDMLKEALHNASLVHSAPTLHAFSVTPDGMETRCAHI
jgi:hypothetical protein